MGPEYYKPGSSGALKKCSERVTNDCDSTETDSCCAGPIPCAYCIEWNPETGDTVYAAADFATNGWAATIAGAAWFASWQRNYDTNECEFVVTLDDVEIYRKSCYEGQSCRDSSDSAAATINEIAGVITWTKYEPRPLEYIQDPDTNCTTYFCDECECSCECLCVTVSEFISEGIYETHTGEICDVAYQCDPPLWAGTVGPYDLSLALSRDEYGRCVIVPSVDEVEQDPVLFPGCADAGEVTITLADTSTITVRCKKCDCGAAVSLCCGGRNLSTDLTLTLIYPGTSGTVDCGDTVLTLTQINSYTWTASGSVLVEVPGGEGEECVEITAYFEFYCDPAGPLYEMKWRFEYLGTEYPVAPNGSDPDENGKRWCGLIRDSEDCECPYLGVWSDNNVCGMQFWNSFFTFMVEESEEACA